jgi:hypothetical protein
LAELFLSEFFVTGVELKVKKSKVPANKTIPAITDISKVLLFLDSSRKALSGMLLIIIPSTSYINDQGN